MERNTPKPETAEQLGQQLLEFVDATEFGTAEFQAASDYLDLLALREDKEDGDRIRELEIALLRHQIKQNKCRLPGYSRAHQRIERDFTDLQTVSRLEAEQKFEDLNEQHAYITQIYQTAFNGAEETVSKKKDAS